MNEAQMHTLEFLLAFDGRLHWYEQGYFTKFEIKRVEPSKERPHGLRYSFTLHDPEGKRLMGFDNAHTVAAAGRNAKRQIETDHWHRTESDKGRAYKFKDAEKLIDDFFAEVERILTERKVPIHVVRDAAKPKPVAKAKTKPKLKGRKK
ncbi:MAG: DUF6516 family protein [Pseudomonadota bacterium]